MLVIAILVMLMTVGVSLFHHRGAQSRKAGTERLLALIEQARTRAITSKSTVLLAIVEPDPQPFTDQRCRLGLFCVDTWTNSANPQLPLQGVLTHPWQTLNPGIVLLPGTVAEIENLLDQPTITIHYGGARNLSVQAHAIAFNSRGGLHYPIGSSPIVIRLAEGVYRHGIPYPNRRDSQKTLAENCLKIGRVTARPYSIHE